jgi:N-acylneuraminate cytidylyltransferase
MRAQQELGQPLVIENKPGASGTIGSAEVAREVTEIDAVVVSTDCPEIATVAQAHGIAVINRPAELSTDAATSKVAVMHAVKAVEATHSGTVEVVVLLQPTSPLRNADDVRATLAPVLSGAADSAATFCPARSHPARTFRLTARCPEPFLTDAGWEARQALEPAWVINGAVYAVGMAAFRANPGPAFLFGRQVGIPMTVERSADIDTAFDFALAEAAAAYLESARR